LAAFSGHEQVVTFTPGFTAVDNLVPGPIHFQGLTLTSFGTVPPGSGTAPYQTWFGIKNNANQSGWFANIPGASQGNIAVDNASKSDIDIDFSSPVGRAGLLLASPVNDSWTILAYDTHSALLGSFTVTNTAAHAVFAGYESISNNLSRLEIKQSVDNGLVTAFDDIRFEALPSSVPLPPAVWAGAVTLLCMGGVAWSRAMPVGA
jgi:hypothetical protein